MKLVILEYLRSLRERRELEVVLPDLLAGMGFTVFSRPSIGPRQFGVDVAAVGPGWNDGVRRVHLFSIKSGNLSRQDWDTVSPQSLRPSLNEILDYYIDARIPSEYSDLPVAVCICVGGDIEENVGPELRGFCRKNSTDRVTFEEWNGDRLADGILRGLLKEELLPSDLRDGLRKAVALIEEPANSFSHFSKLARSLADKSASNAQRITNARILGLCNWILFGWARDSGNLEAPFRCTELSVLLLWDTLNPIVRRGGKPSETAGLLLFELINLHFSVWDEFIGKKVIPRTKARDALATAVSSPASIDVNLKMFDLLGKIALRGVWHVWGAGKPGQLPGVLESPQGENHDNLDQICTALNMLIANNRALLSPATDEQAIDIGIALTVMGSRPAYWSVTQEWVQELTRNSIFAFQTHGRYPTTSKSYWELVEHPAERTDTYRKASTEGSVLYPMLALWLEAFGLSSEELAHCNHQLWLPDDDSEGHLYRNGDAHGAVLCGIPVSQSGNTVTRFVNVELAANQHFDELSAMRLGHWPLIVMACRHYRFPLPPQLWRDLLESILRRGNAIENPTSELPRPLRRRRVSKAQLDIALAASASRITLSAKL